MKQDRQAHSAVDFGWFEKEVRGHGRISDVNRENQAKVRVIEALLNARLRWYVTSTDQFRFPDNWVGKSSVAYTAELMGVTYLVDEDVSHDGADALHILKCDLQENEVQSFGFIRRWPETWVRN